MGGVELTDRQYDDISGRTAERTKLHRRYRLAIGLALLAGILLGALIW